jgi:multimeric flavodoxin WrbA
MDDFERKNHLITVCDQLKKHFRKDHLQNNLSPRLTKLIAADGIILSAETDVVSLIEEKLDIKIDITDE